MPHDYPRFELLKQEALNLGLSRDQVKEFGSLARRATWESAIAFRRSTNLQGHWNESEIVDNVIHSELNEPHDTRVSNLLSFPQLVALFFLIVGLFALIGPVLRIPLPIKITIQIGANK
jgi:hypothetical protein